jgi:hypothetical protein
MPQPWANGEAEHHSRRASQKNVAHFLVDRKQREREEKRLGARYTFLGHN